MQVHYSEAELRFWISVFGLRPIKCGLPHGLSFLVIAKRGPSHYAYTKYQDNR
jgi:hypothetical protein